MSFNLVIKYIKHKINNFSNLKLKENTTFTNLAKKINDKEVLIISKEMLGLLIYEKNNIHLKKFLSCYMITQHSKVLISQDNSIEKDVLKLSYKIIKYIDKIKESNTLYDFNIYKIILNLYYTKYIELFDIWKESDKLKILNDLITIYFELENDKIKRYDNIDQDSNKQFIISIEREQKQIIEKIKQIDGENGMNYFNDIKTQINSYKTHIKKLYTNIEDNLHDAYWNNIRTELSKKPPNNIIIVDLLIELKEMLLSCNRNIKEEIDQNIDIDFIKDMISHNVINNNYIYQMCMFIITYIEQFQSPAHDEETLNWKESVIDKFKTGSINNEEFFPFFFRGVFEKIRIILYEIDIFKYLAQNNS